MSASKESYLGGTKIMRQHKKQLNTLLFYSIENHECNNRKTELVLRTEMKKTVISHY